MTTATMDAYVAKLREADRIARAEWVSAPLPSARGTLIDRRARVRDEMPAWTPEQRAQQLAERDLPYEEQVAIDEVRRLEIARLEIARG